MRTANHLDNEVLTRTLAVLGFRRLDQFLQSEDWRKIESRILEERPQCQRCPSRSTKVKIDGHDLLTMTGNRDERLTALCGQCFTLATWKPKEPRTPWPKRERFISAEETRAKEKSRGETTFNRVLHPHRVGFTARQQRRELRAKRKEKRRRHLERRSQQRAAARAATSRQQQEAVAQMGSKDQP